MDGRIGGPPANGHHAAFAWLSTMAGAPRDRVIIDLRGIGDAVRSAAAQRRVTIAHLARQTLLTAVGAHEPTTAPPGSDGPTLSLSSVKITLRMPHPHADALIVNAVGLGLSYGDYVAKLVNGSPLPRPTAERAADRAALLASNDQLATLSADLNALARLLGQGRHEEAQKYRQRLETADAEVRRHLERASAFLGDAERSKP